VKEANGCFFHQIICAFCKEGAQLERRESKMVIIYAIYFEEIRVGTLEISAKGQHRYTPVLGTERPWIPQIHSETEGTDWREPIPLFDRKIYNAKRFAMERDIYSHTDNFRMVLVE